MTPLTPGQIAAKFGSRIVTAFVALAAVLFLANSFSIIAPGNTGVIFNVWTGSLRTVPQGMAFRVPFVSQVQSYPTALRTYTMVRKSGEGSSSGDDSIDLPTKEGQRITQDISVTYNTSEDKAAEVFKAFRGADMVDIESTFIRRTIITISQNVAGQMSLSEIISSKRNDLQDKIQEMLQAELVKMGFRLDKVNLGASHLPASLETQMQAKMAAQQQAQQAEYELQKQQMLAKATVAKAEGEAQSVLVRAKADAAANVMLQTTLTPILVRNKTIEKWDGRLPQVTGGGNPFITLERMGAPSAGASGDADKEK